MEYVQNVLDSFGTFFEFSGQPNTGCCYPLDIESGKRLLAIEALEQHLPCSHNSLRQFEENSALLNEFASKNPKEGFGIGVDAIFKGRRVVELVLGQVKSVDGGVNHLQREASADEEEEEEDEEDNITQE